MLLRRPLLAVLLSLTTPVLLPAQARKATAPTLPQPWAALLLPRTHRAAPTVAAITPGDLRTRLFIFSDDSMAGRRAGTEGNVKGVEYLAAQAKAIGLIPAGQDGSYFQTFVQRFKVRSYDSAGSGLVVDSIPLAMWTDYLPRPVNGDPAALDHTPVVYGGNWTDSTSVISSDAARGKFVVIVSSVTAPNNPPHIPNRQDVAAHFSDAAAVAVVGLDDVPAGTIEQFRAPSQFFPGTPAPVYMYITRAAAGRLLGVPLADAQKGMAGRTVTAHFAFTESEQSVTTAAPLRNVVALLPGSDPALRGEYVVIGAHNDHLGTSDTPVAHDSIYIVDHLYRPRGADDAEPTLSPAQQQVVGSILARVRRATRGRSARPDSIYNGADDDGSGSVSLLEIAQYLSSLRVKPKRSVLFVWHVGEELGMWGSTNFVDHPTVPRDSIVAELNLDMVGRGGARDITGADIHGTMLHGGPGYVQVVGSHRLSDELGDLAESVNTRDRHGLHFDYAMDANGHPEQIYCRSDHAEYARYGIPIAFFTTGLHADYHQVTDEPQYIDYARLAQVDNFVADLARHVADLDHRVKVDHPVGSPDAACVQ